VKDVSPAATYVSMIPPLTIAAREVGYALAVHGSMGRDLDLVAVPWIEEAVSAEQLIMRLLSACGYAGGHVVHRDERKDLSQGNGDLPGIKPHGRRAWSIHFQNGMYLDVSVMPRAAMPTPTPPAPVTEDRGQK
jgi:hypothetical protein